MSAVEIREVTLSDARKLNRYIKHIFATSDHLITHPEEYTSGAIKQRHWIAKKLTSPLEVCFIAVCDGNIVGMLDNWTDARRRVSHSTCFAMSVDAAMRGKGVGKQLLHRFIDWVRQHPSLTRVELHVHSDNTAAISLYKSCGFVLEGTREKAVRYEDGRIVDDYLMALWPKDFRGETT